MEFYGGLTPRDFDRMTLGEYAALVRHIDRRSKEAADAARQIGHGR